MSAVKSILDPDQPLYIRASTVVVVATMVAKRGDRGDAARIEAELFDVLEGIRLAQALADADIELDRRGRELVKVRQYNEGDTTHMVYDGGPGLRIEEARNKARAAYAAWKQKERPRGAS